MELYVFFSSVLPVRHAAPHFNFGLFLPPVSVLHRGALFTQALHSIFDPNSSTISYLSVPYTMQIPAFQHVHIHSYLHSAILPCDRTQSVLLWAGQSVEPLWDAIPGLPLSAGLVSLGLCKQRQLCRPLSQLHWAVSPATCHPGLCHTCVPTALAQPLLASGEEACHLLSCSL